MSIGQETPTTRTTNFSLTRTQLIEKAYRVIGILEPGQAMDAEMLEEGESSLNLIVRETDVSGKWRWTVESSFHLPLSANVSVYTVQSGELPDNIVELITVKYRNAAGLDYPIEIITAERYETIALKTEAGIPLCVYLTEHINLEDRSLYIWKTPSEVQTQSEVEDANVNYRCIRPHTSSLLTRPGVGANWTMYWEVGGGNGSAWSQNIDYVSTDQLRITHRRPLLDFNHAEDRPDFPVQWPRMILYKLAFDLGDIWSIPLPERELMIQKAKAAYKDIFPSVKNKSSNGSRHNKAKYF